MTDQKALAVQPQGQLISASWEEKTQLIRDMYPKAKPAELELFFHQAKRMGLDPLCRQIHLVTRKKKVWRNGQQTWDTMSSIQVGIDGYRAVADRTGRYAGNDDPTFDEGLTQAQMLNANRAQPKTATVKVYKVVGGVRCDFVSTAMWEAYAPKGGDDEGGGGFMWKKMPFLMLGKCAEALALRKAFPAELSGVYTDAEMDQAGIVIDAPKPAEAEVPKLAEGAKPLSTDVREHYQEPAQKPAPAPVAATAAGMDEAPAQPSSDAFASFSEALKKCDSKEKVDVLWKSFRADNASNSEALNLGIRAKADRVRELGGAK